MSSKNKKLVEGILSGELELLDHFSNDGIWMIPGINSYHGKQEIVEKFLQPLSKQMVSMGSKEVTNIVAEGDFVVVESYAKDRLTKSGKSYNNTYCVIYHIVDGEIQKLTEYCDTALIKDVFGDLARA